MTTHSAHHGNHIAEYRACRDSNTTLVDLPCGCQDVHYGCGYISHEHEFVACDRTPQLVVLYHSGGYRIHAAGCSHIRREQDRHGIETRSFYPAGTSLAEMARHELADFIDEGSFTPERAAAQFTVETTVITCARGLIG